MSAATAVRECVTCGGAVRYRAERECQRISDAGWIHVGTGERRAPGSGQYPQFDFHWAEPVPQCPQCGSLAYVGSQQAWGNAWDCGDCGHHVYCSIGD